MNMQENNIEPQITYSVVVPVYNSTKSLVELCKGLDDVFTNTLNASYEIILVDDASPNSETWSVMEKIHKENNNVRVFQLMHNSGQHNATMCGLKHSMGNFVFTMDDDLQHPPEEIPKLIKAMGDSTQYDAILAVPKHREHSTFRNVGSYLLNKMLGFAIKKPKHITLSSFRLITGNLRNAMLGYSGYIVTISSLICQTTQNLTNIEVLHNPRVYGKSNYSIGKLIRLAIANVFNFSSFPLKLISVVGFVSFVISMIYAAWVIYRRVVTKTLDEPGFATIAVLVSSYSGLILFSFGVLGQYIMRIMKAVTGGAQFVVRKKLD